MTLTQLKQAAAAMGITPDEARVHGHIGHKATWQAAIDAATQAVTEAQQPAQDTAEAVCDVLYSQQSRDAVQWVAAAVLMVVFTFGLLVYRVTTALWQASQPYRQQLIRRRDNWLTAQASYAALVLLLLRAA